MDTQDCLRRGHQLKYGKVRATADTIHTCDVVGIQELLQTAHPVSIAFVNKPRNRICTEESFHKNAALPSASTRILICSW